MVIGEFEDDYQGRFSISPTEFRQWPRNRFHILKWNPDGQYFIARNDSLNSSDGNLHTRLDWVPLKDMPPWEWAFCFSAYKAPTAADAEATNVVNRETPRTGCNGFPFSRMRRVKTP